jgi:ParB family chromosome partitioning protein
MDKKNDDPLKYEFSQIQSKLSTHFGTKVNIKTNEHNKGEIKIPFTSEEDLNRILDLLNM